MSQQKVEKLKNTKIWVDNPELHKQIQPELFKLGIYWGCGATYTQHKDSDFLAITKKKVLKHGDSERNFYQIPERILEVPEFFKIINGINDMKKSHLHSQHIVELRNCERGIVIDGDIILQHGYMPLNSYNENLLQVERDKISCDHDIMKVYDVGGAKDILAFKNIDMSIPSDCLIWNRNDNVKELTFDEISEKFGIPKEQIRIKDNEYERC